LKQLLKLGRAAVPYIQQEAEVVVTNSESRINTEFFVDHSQLSTMLGSVVSADSPWRMGNLPEGWEWFAFTFSDQDQISLSPRELKEMLDASDEVTREAYSRMPIGSPSQIWARFTSAEADFIVETFGLVSGQRLVDFGCGPGRHTLELVAKGLDVTGVDYVKAFIGQAQESSVKLGQRTAHFVIGDCRKVALGTQFDAAICLYDVVGSYVEEADNFSILKNLVKHLKPGGLALISVMNMELTEHNAKHWFSISSEPDKLLALRPSNTMERSGEVFDPEYYMIERETGVVYRKEQFEGGTGLPEELIVRDRRYTSTQIRDLCCSAGLDVIWHKFVRAGRWQDELDKYEGKEVLLFCRKPVDSDLQGTLFDFSEIH
jgi:2-polyprenyl-3-methyl-5-hydroxy-6-metoxy-1,4-benzoquinol methylase